MACITIIFGNFIIKPTVRFVNDSEPELRSDVLENGEVNTHLGRSIPLKTSVPSSYERHSNPYDLRPFCMFTFL